MQHDLTSLNKLISVLFLSLNSFRKNLLRPDKGNYWVPLQKQQMSSGFNHTNKKEVLVPIASAGSLKKPLKNLRLSEYNGDPTLNKNNLFCGITNKHVQFEVMQLLVSTSREPFITTNDIGPLHKVRVTEEDTRMVCGYHNLLVQIRNQIPGNASMLAKPFTANDDEFEQIARNHAYNYFVDWAQISGEIYDYCYKELSR